MSQKQPQDPQVEPEETTTGPAPGEELAAAAGDKQDGKKPKKKKDPTIVWTRRILILCVLFFVWYLCADRFTPFTGQARVRGYVIPIVPEVSGVISEVNVGLNELVETDQLLVKISTADYQLAVEEAELALKQAGQNVGASTADVAAATAGVAEAKASLAHAMQKAERVIKAEKTGAVSASEADRARTSITQNEANVKTAEARLEEARQRLGDEGKDNTSIRTAQKALEDAQLDLTRTVIRCPSSGGVTNMRLEAGQYATAGQPLMTFVSDRVVWIEAYLRENSLAHIEPGARVDIVLDVAPGKIFKGKVQSIGYGVNWGGSNSAAELPKISASRDWLRDPQRFPVIIVFEDDSARGKNLLREGGQVDVIVYTGKSAILNPLGRAWIRVVSLFSYVR